MYGTFSRFTANEDEENVNAFATDLLNFQEYTEETEYCLDIVDDRLTTIGEKTKFLLENTKKQKV